MALLWFACFQGDLRRVRWCVARGSDINQPDYDGRTALHIAASEGRESITSFLLLQGALCDALDRFNNKPIDDAKREKHRKITRILRMSCESVSQSVSQSTTQPLNHSINDPSQSVTYTSPHTTQSKRSRPSRAPTRFSHRCAR
jgi:glutaminase